MCGCMRDGWQIDRLSALQHMRVPNSGTASPRDINLGWEQLQAAALQTLVLKRNARPDGRGLSDLRDLRCEVGTAQLHCHGFWVWSMCDAVAASRTAACPHAEGSSDLWSPVSDVAMKLEAVCAACALRSHHVCSQLGTLQVGCLPVVHGSALVSAGSSQASLFSMRLCC